MKELCPQIDLTCGGKRHPILGSSYHPPGSVIRHDAVVWGYAAAAQRLGVHIYEGVEVTGIDVRSGRVQADRDELEDASSAAQRSARPAGYVEPRRGAWPGSAFRSSPTRSRRS